MGNDFGTASPFGGAGTRNPPGVLEGFCPDVFWVSFSRITIPILGGSGFRSMFLQTKRVVTTRIVANSFTQDVRLLTLTRNRLKFQLLSMPGASGPPVRIVAGSLHFPPHPPLGQLVVHWAKGEEGLIDTYR